MNKKANVLYLTNIPSPYMVEYLDELGKLCRVSVLFEKDADRTRPLSWRIGTENGRRWHFRYKVLNGKSVSNRIYGDKLGFAPDDKAFSPSVTRYIAKDRYDIIIVANPCTPTGIWAIYYMKQKKIPYSVQSEGGFPGSGCGFKERLKRYLMKDAELFFSTCRLDDEYFYTYGASRDRIRRYIFTSVHRCDVPDAMMDRDEKSAIKNKLGIDTELALLTVGRSVPVKGYDILLKAFRGIDDALYKEVGKHVSFIFAGADHIQEYKMIVNTLGIKRVYFTGQVSNERIADYYRACDVFCFASRGDTWGLVINESMMYGLPIVSSNKCVATDALVKDGINGKVVEMDNVDGFHDAIYDLLVNEELRTRISRKNFEELKDYTYERMALEMAGHISRYAQEKH